MVWFITGAVLAFALGVLAYCIFRFIRDKKNLELAKTEAQILIESAKKEAQKIKAGGELQAREIIEKSKSEVERETRERHKEFSKAEKRLQAREENLDKKYESVERREMEIARKEREITTKDKIVIEKEKELDSIITEAKKRIEDVAGMTQEAAKKELINVIENEAKHDAAKKLKQIEDELHEKC